MNTAFLFPGQGSQFEGMGCDVAKESLNALQRFKQADDQLGWDILELKKTGSVPSLDITIYTQPAVYVVSCVTSEYLAENGVKPSAVAGHSAGEFAALTTAGAWDFETGLNVISQRACLMHKMAGPGAMAAVLGLDADAIRETCEAFEGGLVSVANYNSPKQTVITGEAAAIEEVIPLLKEKGARRVMKLPVSGAFHSPLMKKAQDEFRRFMENIEIKEPNVAWISNNTAQPESDPARIKELLIGQFCSSVRWVESMDWMKQNTDRAVEVGPGEVLCGLSKACLEDYACQSTSTVENIKEIVKANE
jgi:[acyl-carrier-protein] S-malonyltransferase